MNVVRHNDLVELQARVIIIRSYVQFLLLESATMPQYHEAIEGHLTKLQTQIRELELLCARVCDTATPNGDGRLSVIN